MVAVERDGHLGRERRRGRRAEHVVSRGPRALLGLHRTLRRDGRWIPSSRVFLDGPRRKRGTGGERDDPDRYGRSDGDAGNVLLAGGRGRVVPWLRGRDTLRLGRDEWIGRDRC